MMQIGGPGPGLTRIVYCVTLPWGLNSQAYRKVVLHSSYPEQKEWIEGTGMGKRQCAHWHTMDY